MLYMCLFFKLFISCINNLRLMFKLLNKVYVINLKKNKDRRFHVTNELCRVGLGNKMKIFDAIDKDSIEVINLMKGDFS